MASQRIIPLAAGAPQQIVARGDRVRAVINIGVNRATMGFGSAPTADQGWPLAAAAVQGDQGGGLDFNGSITADAAIHAISAAGTTLVVLEG